MRLTTLGLAFCVPFVAVACGQSLKAPIPFDAGLGSDDLSAGGGGGSGTDMTRAGDLAGGADGAFDDTTGPTITITTPTAGSFVKGVFAIEATITDPSGVDTSSVSAEFGNDASTKIALTRTTGDTFAGVFDVSVLAKSYVLAAISIRAKDGVGNESQLGEEIVVDIVKPWMTMDSSKMMQVSKHDTNNAIECSRPFSPLGDDAAHEGQVVPQLITLRTRIEDHGNNAPGLAVERFSTVDQSTVQMFIIHDDGNTPLAVDTDNPPDGYCDEINPLLIPTTGPIMMQDEALSLQMVPLPPTGAADFRTGTATSFCPEVGDGTATQPKAICADTPLTYVLSYSTSLPAIYTLPPVKSGDPIDCSGFQLDAANQLIEGPACVVTRAVDKAGNVEVSFPLHICIDLGNHMCDTYPPTGVASHCTGVFDKVKMMPVAGTCIEPKPAQSAPPDGPATFATDGSDVEFIGP